MLQRGKEVCNKMTGTAREFHSILMAPFLQTNHSFKSVPQRAVRRTGGPIVVPRSDSFLRWPWEILVRDYL